MSTGANPQPSPNPTAAPVPSATLMPPPPPPPTPRQPGESDSDYEERKEAAYIAAAEWLFQNYGLVAEGERGGQGRVVPLRTRTATTTALTAFRTKMLPWRLIRQGPRGGTTKLSSVDLWLTLPGRVEIAGFRVAPDQPWPHFTENGRMYVNLYLRPELPEDGDATMGHRLLEALLPDKRERDWFKQFLAYKLQHPAWPGPGIVMVAKREFGTGRGTLFRLIGGMFGQMYIATPSFATVIGEGSQGAFNGWMADGLFALIGETSASDNNRRQRQHEIYDRLKELVEPERKERQIVRKYEHQVEIWCGPSFIFASNVGTPMLIMDKDRRFAFLTNGEPQPQAFWDSFATWMKDPANVGAFRAELEKVSLNGFNPHKPLHTTLKDIVADEARFPLEELIDEVLGLLPGNLVLREQVVEAVAAIADHDTIARSGWKDLVRLGVQEKCYRVGHKDRKLWKLTAKGRKDGSKPVYAKSAKARAYWNTAAGTPGKAQHELNLNEDAIAKLAAHGVPNITVIDGGGGRSKARGPKTKPESGRIKPRE